MSEQEFFAAVIICVLIGLLSFVTGYLDGSGVLSLP